MSRITTTVVTLLLTTAAFGQAKDDAGDGKKLDKQTMEIKDYLPEIHGTIRGKYEYQKKTAISKKEEQQAQKVVKIVFVSLIILALVMLVAFSFFG